MQSAIRADGRKYSDVHYTGKTGERQRTAFASSRLTQHGVAGRDLLTVDEKRPTTGTRSVITIRSLFPETETVQCQRSVDGERKLKFVPRITTGSKACRSDGPARAGIPDQPVGNERVIPIRPRGDVGDVRIAYRHGNR